MRGLMLEAKWEPKKGYVVSEFEKRAGYKPVSSAAQVYASFTLMADAIKRAGSADPAKVRDALAATADVEPPSWIHTDVGFSTPLIKLNICCIV